MSDSPQTNDETPGADSNPAKHGGEPVTSSFSWKRVIVTVLSLVLIAGIATGAVWYVANQEPEVYQVEGIVLLDGEPMAGGVIQTTHTGGWPGAYGGIDKDGHFMLMTDGPGAYEGEHKVTFSLMGTGMPPASLIPEKYSDPETSGFTLTVNAQTKNEEVKFELVGRKETAPSGGRGGGGGRGRPDGPNRPDQGEKEPTETDNTDNSSGDSTDGASPSNPDSEIEENPN